MDLCFATNNAHKLSEVRAILPKRYSVLSLNDIGCVASIPEEQNTLRGNAHQKASYVRVHFGVDCFADDTGLEVDALGGAPGVFSARYAGPERQDVANYTRLLEELKDQENRAACFRTVICLIRAQDVHYFEGVVNGNITREPHGNQGFGYDPVFLPDGSDLTFAEMSGPQKNLNSHRGAAVGKLVDFLSQD
jgi:XTP/dITP diphosphohydrolase